MSYNIIVGGSEVSSVPMTFCQRWVLEPVLGPRGSKLIHRAEVQSFPQGLSQAVHCSRSPQTQLLVCGDVGRERQDEGISETWESVYTG